MTEDMIHPVTPRQFRLQDREGIKEEVLAGKANLSRDTTPFTAGSNGVHNRSTIALLEKLGLSKTEVKCYLAALTLGSAKISDIAKTANINRVNAYGAIKNLADRGLVEQEMTGKGRRVYSAPLEHLQELAQDYQNQAARCRWKIENLLPKLTSLQLTSTKQPRMIFFEEGKETWKKLYERSLSATPGSEILFIGAYPVYVIEYDQERYIPERMKRNVTARCLNHKTPEVVQFWKRDKKEMRESRFLPSKIDFPCEILMYNNEVAILWESRNENAAGVVIQGDAITGVMKSLFEMAWQTAGTKKQ